MDLNISGFLFPQNGQLNNSYTDIGHFSNSSKIDNLGDTVLCLDCPGYKMSRTPQVSTSQNNLVSLSSKDPDDGCRLVLGLGPTPSSYPGEATKNKESSSMFCQWLTSDRDSGILKLGLSRETEEFTYRPENSASGDDESIPSHIQNQFPAGERRLHIPIVDEGSTSAKRNFGGYMPSLLLAPRLECDKSWPEGELRNGILHQFHSSPEPSAATGTDCSVGVTSGATKVGASSENRSHHPKKCRFKGCSKGARGASGLCIAHGGGQRCQKPGCNKGAESRAAYCKAHGGGKRCQRLGCTKSAEGKTDYCIAHGGGRRCGHPGCTKAARGKSGLCIRHGGGKRCKIEGCDRSAEGQAGLCISHGGGRRCQYVGCTKGAQGSTMYCKAHGGGKRCIFAGCTKGAEGSTPLCKGHGGGKRCLYDSGGICPKSVHGGTDYCVAHGGGKRCSVPGCTKSARGRTDCCVRHGGGKRCRFENCGKSAQGSTDFCKAHGGGKRCTWGDGSCEKFARGKSGLCAAHGSMVQDREVPKGSLISPGLFHGIVCASTMGSSLDNDHSSAASALSDCVESSGNTWTRQLIPPQLLVPLSMKTSSSSGLLGVEREYESGKGNSSGKACNFVVPEGRVHGGGLMSLLGGNLNNA